MRDVKTTCPDHECLVGKLDVINDKLDLVSTKEDLYNVMRDVSEVRAIANGNSVIITKTQAIVGILVGICTFCGGILIDKLFL